MESKSREKESERERKGEAVDPGEPRRQAARLARARHFECGTKVITPSYPVRLPSTDGYHLHDHSIG